MNIPIKDSRELAIMEIGGQKLAKIINVLKTFLIIGNSGVDVEQAAKKLIDRAGGRPSFMIANPQYKYATCISINDAIVHGLPTPEKFRSGDIVGLDIGLYYNGFHLDAAVTVGIGQVSSKDRALIRVTQESLDRAIALVKPGIKLGVISRAVQEYVENHGFSVIRQLAGHGVGRALHEPPSIPNFGETQDGPVLETGMVLAIEPMVSAGGWRVIIDEGGWTVRLLDGSNGAHFEHTVAVTRQGVKVLTDLDTKSDLSQ